DVACRHVRELAEVTVELGHEALTEPHHLAVGASFRIEVRAALRAADRHSGDGVLERLLEAEKLDDPEVDRRMEAQAALVRAESAVEADTEPAVDVHLAAVVLPRHAEDDLPLGLADPLDDLVLRVLRVFAQDRRKRRGYLRNCLKELAFAGI